MAHESKWREFPRGVQCPICGHEGRCKSPTGLADSDLIGCFRVSDAEINAYRRLKQTGECSTFMRNGSAIAAPDTTLGDLAAEIHVSLASLQALEVTKDSKIWAFPEKDATGNVTALNRRFPDGSKRVRKGDVRGLIYPADIADRSDAVFIVEGPSDVAAALTMGMTAVGRPMAKGGVPILAELLKGRECIVVGENDQKPSGDWPGLDGAEYVARELSKAWGKPVPYRMPPAGTKDVRAWLVAHPGDPHEAGRQFVASCTRQPPSNAGEAQAEPAGAAKDEADDDDDDGERKPSQAELIVQLALRHYRVGRTEHDEAFAVRAGGPSIAIMFKGSRDALRASLSKAFRSQYGKTPNASAIADALCNLQGEALDVSPEATHLRIADDADDSVVIDLGTHDGRAVRVSAAGWIVLNRSPVLFRRTALTAALPLPSRGGDVESLRELLNVGEDNWPLLLGFIVAAFIPSIAHPALMFGGEAGSGKTTAARILVSLFDPSTAPLRSQPSDVEQWCIAASGSYGVAIDNVSTITPWWSDSLCKAVSGDGWVRRRLYSDGDLAVTSFRRVIILTSIDAGALRGDLGDRLLLCELDRIADSARRSETEILRSFERLRPSILGALLDVVATVMAKLPTVSLTAGPRMMDFARVLAAMDLATGTRSLELYMGQRDSIASDVVEADPVAKAVVELVERGGEWSGITKDLLALITPEHPPRSWPRSPHSLAGRLRHAAPALRQIGIEVVRPGRDVNRKRDRRIVIRKVAETIVRNVRTSETLDFERKNGTMPRTMPDDADEVSKTIVHSDNRVSGPQTPLSDDVDDVDDAAAYLSDCDTFTCDHEIPADYLDDEEEAAERGVV